MGPSRCAATAAAAAPPPARLLLRQRRRHPQQLLRPRPATTCRTSSRRAAPLARTAAVPDRGDASNIAWTSGSGWPEREPEAEEPTDAAQVLGSQWQPAADWENARIRCIGCGGGGNNALARMIDSGLQGVEFWAVNTDAQSLVNHPAPNKVQLGAELTRGLGCGGSAELGAQAAHESHDALQKMVQGADLVFITAGMGGGTGTGVAPVLSKVSKDLGILTVAVVTYPFGFEGRRRAKEAAAGIEKLRQNVDSVIVIPNDRLLDVAGQKTGLQDAFGLADDVLRQGVQGIADLITVPGLVNVDFADVKAIMTNSGTAMLGMGVASGPDRAEQAAESATSAPLIQTSIQRATGIVYNITGGSDMTLNEINRVSEVVTGLADASCNIIFGAVVDESYEGMLSVSIIATGFSQSFEESIFTGRKPASSSARRAVAEQQAAAQAPEVAEAAPEEPAAPFPEDELAGGFRLPWQKPSRAEPSFLGRSIF